jgi:hypothetical protein
VQKEKLGLAVIERSNGLGYRQETLDQRRADGACGACHKNCLVPQVVESGHFSTSERITVAGSHKPCARRQARASAGY